MRKLMWFTIGFAAASLAGSIVYGNWILLGSAIVFLVAGLLGIFSKKHKNIGAAFLVALGIAIGFAWFFIYDNLFVLVPRVADGQTFYATIEATDYADQTDYGSAVEGKMTVNGKSYRVKAYLHIDEEVNPGDRVSGTFRFRLTTAGGSNEATSHQTEGIFLLAYPIGGTTIEKCTEVSWKHYPAMWRRQILNRIDEIFTGDAAAFASALLLGERSNLSYELRTAFQTSGISHIIAVSGLHVSILFGLVYTLLGRRRVLAFLIGVPVLFLFAAVAGFGPSITRACIMQSLMLLAMVLDREYDPPTSLAFAVLVMLVCNPLIILSVSFQLSVGCLIGIFLFGERMRQYLSSLFERKSKKNKFFAKMITAMTTSASITLSASIITTPLVAYYFGCVSLVSVLTNILVVWIVSFIFSGIILCLVASLLSIGFGSVLAWIVSLPSYFVIYTARVLGKIPLGVLYTSNLYTVLWLVGAYILLALFLFQKKKKPALLLGCILFTMLLSQVLAWAEPMQDDFRMTMLDVGQGQSIILQSEGKTVLIDCGSDDCEEAADITAEALLSQGISRVDGIIVTHSDKDHAGGIANLLTRISTDRLILPYVEDEDGTLDTLANSTDGVVDFVQQDMIYSFGDTKITVFAPFNYYSGNESSICILFQWKECGILITGDRGEYGENVLLNEHAIPKVNVLVAGHHGSAGSTGDALLKAADPEIVMISVGEDNRYGHPSNVVLDKLEKLGCEIFRTDIHGTIIYRG